MHQRQPRHFESGAVLASVLALVAILGLAPRVGHAQAQCATEFQEQTSGTVADGGTICATAVGNKCTFQLELCVNQPEASCTPQDLKTKKIRASSPALCAGGIGKVNLKANGTNSVCGSFVGVTVKTKKHGTKARSCKIRGKAKKAKTSITLLCQPESTPCSGATTTTTSSTSTTTTTMPPPCTCATSSFTQLLFTTGIGSGNCGMVQISSGAVTKHLACGGLYTGGGSNSVPLPYAVPDMGNSLTALTGCSATTLTLGNLTSTGTGSNRNCTSVGCLFGPPLPIPNPASPPTSVCVINTVATNASGTADCTTGESALSLPLTSALFLDGDLFPQSGGMDHCMGGTAAGAVCHARCVGGLNDGSFCTNFCGNAACTAAATPFACCTGAAMGNCDNSNCTAAGTPNACCTGAGTGACNGTCNVFLSGGGSNSDCPGGFCTVGVQACPLCAADGKCHGGDNDGGACTPADSPINSNFPTSQDCPPPAGNNIGSLPIAFALTTGTKTMTSVDQANQPRSFCGFCRDINNQSSGCFAGDQTGACPDPKPAGPVSCNTNADCPAAYPDCQQRNSGAFGPAGGGARTITETGSPAPGLSDGMGHPSTLVSIFCIPPTFNATVDSAGDLPAPGAVALSGTAQLLP